MNNMYQRYQFKDYNEYTQHQINRGQRNQGMAARHAPTRNDIIKLLKTNYPSVKTMLCLGSRHAREVVDFTNAGYETMGIDLFEKHVSYYTPHAGEDYWTKDEKFKNQTEPIIHKCDMAFLNKHDIFRKKEFDAFISAYSIEHCYDIEAFKTNSLPLCKKIFVIVTALEIWDSPPTGKWDCVKYKFTDPQAEAKKEIETLFPEFQLDIQTLTQRGGLLFVLSRKNTRSNPV